MKQVTVTAIRKMKQAGEKITCLTAYDYSFAAQVDAAGIDMVMVGDSLGMVMQGHGTTLPVTLEDMVYHSACVARGIKRALLISDLPFGSYQQGPAQALASSVRLMQEGGAHVVKLEGGNVMAETVRFLVDRGIPVCAHIGLTPQSVYQLGGYRVQGRGHDAAEQLAGAARALEQAGASLIVLEAIPSSLARSITAELEIPTIGIGAGRDCDGQVLVLQDMLGFYPRPSPKFSKNFLADSGGVPAALAAFASEVRSGSFPGPEHSSGE